MRKLTLLLMLILSMVALSGKALTNKPTWTVDPAAYGQDMEVTGQIFIGATAVTSGGLLGAFINGVLQGVKEGGLTMAGKYGFAIRVYGNEATGKTITFKFYDTARDKVYDITETETFVVDGRIGSFAAPKALNCILGTDATLSDLKVGASSVTGFSASTISYTIELPYGTTVVPTVTATTSDNQASKVITPAGALPGSTTVVVTAENGSTQKTYTINFTIAKNNDATLSDLKVSGTTVSGFAAGTLTYNVVLPHNTATVPTVTATSTDANASKLITPAASLPGSTTVLVTAEDGTTIKTYTITFTLAKDTDATLSDLKYGSTSVSGFAAATITYNVVLPHNTSTVPTVTATTTDSNASKTITQASSVTGSATVVVTAEDGTTTKTYTINFSVAKDVDATLSDLKVNGSTISDFVPGTTTYSVVLPYGTSVIPTVTGTTNDINATKTITQATSVTGTATVAVRAEDGTTTKTYTINFSVGPNNVATLSDLKVSAVTITGFSSTTLTYNVALPHNTTVVPTVTATTTDVNATKVITPAASLPGTTTIEVTAENGTTKKTYSISFTIIPDTDATLSDLKYNGISVAGFTPGTLIYAVALPHHTATVPTVTATTNDPNATKVVTPAGALPGSTTILVTAEDGTTKKTYTINFTLAKDTDATLSALTVSGTAVAGFSAGTLTYNVVLAHNTTIVPVVAATTNDPNATKVITPAAALPGSTTVVVTAEDGTTIKTYTINFTVAKDNDATLSDLKSGGTTVAGFSSGTLTYHIELPHNTNIVPAAAATTNDPNASRVITPAAALPGSTTVVVTAEDGITKRTYTIAYTIAKETDATLSDLKVGAATVTGFSAGTLTYTVEVSHFTTVVPVVTATTNDPNASKVITPAATLTGSTTILVTAEDGTTKKTYTVTFTIAKDTDASISDLRYNDIVIPGFHPEILTYDIVLPYGTTAVPHVAVVTNDPNATNEITPPTSLPGSTVIVVTAEDGTTKKTYTINFTVQQKSDDATLSDLKVNGTTVTGFSGGTLTYNVVLPHNSTTVPTVIATVNDSKATKVITPAASLPGSTKVVVTAENEISIKTYTINFSIAPDTDATLSDLRLDGVPVTGFSPTVLNYAVVLPYGTTQAPFANATTNDPNATKVTNQAGSVNGTASVVVTAEDGATQKTYTVSFSVNTRKNIATLSDLKVNGTTVEGFRPTKLLYNVVLPFNTTTVPTVTATTSDENATAVITPAASLPGNTTVKVTAEDGVTEGIYTLSFTINTTSNDATLSDLKVNGTTVTGFSASTLTYTVELAHEATQVPTVVVTTNDANAISVITAVASLPGTTTILVTAPDGVTKISYEVIFTLAKNSIATLSGLKVDGTALSGFSPATLTYEYVVSEGRTEVPIVTATTTHQHANADIRQVTSIPGTTIIEVTSEDGTNQLTYEVYIRYPSGSGIDESQSLTLLHVFPNPSNGKFELNYSNSQTLDKRMEVRVSDILGRVFHTENIEREGYMTKVTIDLPECQPGIYFVEVINGKDRKVERLIIN